MSDTRWDVMMQNRNPELPPTLLVGSTTTQDMRPAPPADRRHWFQAGTEVGVCELCGIDMMADLHIGANERGYRRPSGD